MAYLTVIAKIKSEQDKVDEVLTNLLTLVEPTRNEKGCIDYILYQDNEDPSIFIFYENWESKEDLDAHMVSDHFKRCFSNIEGMHQVEAHHLTIME